MTEKPDDKPDRPRISRWAVFRSVLGAVLSLSFVLSVIAALIALAHPDTPLPKAWNPLEPLSISDPLTPLTTWKLRRAIAVPEHCLASLELDTRHAAMDDLEESSDCHIRNRVDLTGVGQARLDAVETTCAVALRLAMWERHGLQPVAQEIYGEPISLIRHIGSYNCRAMRLSNGQTGRMSTHATASAIDITGFDLESGRRIRLLQGWGGDPADRAFLRAARDAACTWFPTTLGPDYNRLHADHFHLQARGWGTCR